MHNAYLNTDLMKRYADVRSLLADPGSITVLHIATEHTNIAFGHGIAPVSTLTLQLGSERTARRYFEQTPPGRLEFEMAIEPVEDEITRARPMLESGSTLYSSDPALRQIALLSGVPDSAEMLLDLDTMERTFSRLAAVIQGKPAAHEGIPVDNVFAATLLILREFMHHLQFPFICILTKPETWTDTTNSLQIS